MALRDELRRLIEATGPISMARFMGEALGHPKYGYYMTRDPFGVQGDFTTAPEISQTFGEMLGIWIIDSWQKLGAPSPVQLIELGPGRGTLMADILRTLKIYPALHDAVQVHFVEMSPTLKAAQHAKHPQAHWHKRLTDVPHGFSFFIANEFFDALPVRQFEYAQSSWNERFVAWDEQNQSFDIILAPTVLASTSIIPSDLPAPQDGDVFEFCPASISIAHEVGTRIAKDDGAALIIDYGHKHRGFGETLQALRSHQYTSILDDPGQADITAHVDFTALGITLKEAGLAVFGPTTQSRFLKAMGIETRARQLVKSADPQQKANIEEGVHRLIADEEMGNLFKALCAAPQNSPILAGFEKP